MPSRTDLIEISKTRLKEVKALYDAELFDGAKYLAGYVVETAIKARICKVLDSEYPVKGDISKSFKTHVIDDLIKLGGLQNQLDNKLAESVKFKANWSLITTWSVADRYNPIGTDSKQEVDDILLALEDDEDGILTWIMKRW